MGLWIALQTLYGWASVQADSHVLRNGSPSPSITFVGSASNPGGNAEQTMTGAFDPVQIRTLVNQEAAPEEKQTEHEGWRWWVPQWLQDAYRSYVTPSRSKKDELTTRLRALQSITTTEDLQRLDDILLETELQYGIEEKGVEKIGVDKSQTEAVRLVKFPEGFHLMLGMSAFQENADGLALLLLVNFTYADLMKRYGEAINNPQLQSAYNAASHKAVLDEIYKYGDLPAWAPTEIEKVFRINYENLSNLNKQHLDEGRFDLIRTDKSI